MTFNSLHSHLIERRFDEAKRDVADDVNNVMVKVLRNRDMPLHMSLLVGAPDDLVISIYKAYPEAVNMKSREGKTVQELMNERNRSAKVKNVIGGNGFARMKSRIASQRSSLANQRSSLAQLLFDTMHNK